MCNGSAKLSASAFFPPPRRAPPLEKPGREGGRTVGGLTHAHVASRVVRMDGVVSRTVHLTPLAGDQQGMQLQEEAR